MQVEIAPGRRRHARPAGRRRRRHGTSRSTETEHDPEDRTRGTDPNQLTYRRVSSAPLPSRPGRPDRARARRAWRSSPSRLAGPPRRRRRASTSRAASRSSSRRSRRKGHKLTPADLDRSVSIMRNRVDKLGVASPEIRKQGTNQIVIQLAGVHDPDAGGAIIGKTAQLELYDLEPALVPPSVDAGAATRSRSRTSTTCSRASRRREERASRAATSSSSPSRCKTRPAPARTRRRRRRSSWVEERRPDDDAAPRPVDRQRGPPRSLPAARCRRAGRCCRSRTSTVVITCDGDEPRGRARATPLGVPPPGKTDYYLFKHGAYPNDQNGAVPEHDRQGPEALGHAAGLRPDDGQPIVLMQFNGKGNKAFYKVTRNEAPARRRSARQSQHFAIVLDNEIRSFPQIDYTDSSVNNGIDPAGTRRADHRHGSLEGGEEPRARPADRRAAGEVRHARAHRRLGDARQGLAEAGAARGDRRPDPRSRSSCSSSTASSASSR